MTGWLRAATQENSWLHRREVQFPARSIRQKARAVVGYTVDRLQNVFRHRDIDSDRPRPTRWNIDQDRQCIGVLRISQDFIEPGWLRDRSAVFLVLTIVSHTRVVSGDADLSVLKASAPIEFLSVAELHNLVSG